MTRDGGEFVTRASPLAPVCGGDVTVSWRTADEPRGDRRRRDHTPQTTAERGGGVDQLQYPQATGHSWAGRTTAGQGRPQAGGETTLHRPQPDCAGAAKRSQRAIPIRSWLQTSRLNAPRKTTPGQTC